VNDTELVHVEVIAERPRRHRGRRGLLVLLLLAALAVTVAIRRRS
jgi:hypothetical protein